MVEAFAVGPRPRIESVEQLRRQLDGCGCDEGIGEAGACPFKYK